MRSISYLLTLAAGIRLSLALSLGFPYGSKKVRGVNLGGWLVLEPWITPSLFDESGDPEIVDEWTFTQRQDRSVATAKLKAHWDSWITESDFAAIAQAGLNHVRIPIGYWAFDVSSDEPFIQGQLEYLLKAVSWAENHGLKVIVDLHGAPGSQNGLDNSGQRMKSPQWQTSQRNIDRTNAIIKKIVSMFADKTNVVTAIAPLNEPSGSAEDQMMTVLRQYLHDSYGNIRDPDGSPKKGNALVIIPDAYKPLSYWKDFMPYPGFEGVMIDTHTYHMFRSEDIQMNNAGHITTACGRSDLTSASLWVVVGEWTPATTDCARHLNGRGMGARYDGTLSPESTPLGSCVGRTGKASTFSAEYKEFLRQFWEAQVITFEKAQGWIQWTWKTEIADEWSYQAGLQNGWIPQNPTDLRYPGVCG